MTAKKTIDYKALNNELETVLASLQSGELSIDEALKAYSRGQVIVTELQSFLKSAENQIKKITTT